MFKKENFSRVKPNRFWMTIVISSIVLFVTACGSPSASSANPAKTSGGALPTSSNAAAVCALLTKDDVSKALNVPVDTIEEKDRGGVCSYTVKSLIVDLTISHTGGKKFMESTLAKLGDVALPVAGLGDQAFYNTGEIAHTLFLLKGDAVYLIDVTVNATDPSQLLKPEQVQAKEKALAVQVLSHLS
jgi:hypothetical protein